jgi:hypothetical protein
MVKVILDLKGLNADDALKLQDACVLIEKGVNSNIFSEKVKNFSYTITKCTGYFRWKKCYTEKVNGFTSTNDSVDLILSNILSGKTQDELGPVSDGVMNIRVGVIPKTNRFSKVIGYTSPGESKTYVYRPNFNAMTNKDLAGHLFHEYIHRVGYDHSSASDLNSAPYAIGYILENILEVIAP